jgi:hypothetical protein
LPSTSVRSSERKSGWSDARAWTAETPGARRAKTVSQVARRFSRLKYSAKKPCVIWTFMLTGIQTFGA